MKLPRLILVTGKGGTGKSTVAAALALALSHRRPATLAYQERPHSAAQILVGAQPRADTHGTPDGKVSLVALDWRRELENFIERIVPFKALAHRMLESRTFSYVSAAVPGLQAFLLLERMRVLAGNAALLDEFSVVDAPATGNALELLDAPAGIMTVAPLGTLNRMASQVHEFLRDPARFGAVLVLKPEEFALRETTEGLQAFERIGARVTAAVINCVPDRLFDAHELKAIRRSVPEHAALAEHRQQMISRALAARRQLRRLGLEVIELPMIFARTLGHAAVAALAERLERELSRP
jgi:anion-transporting  ArsA/GET3 family ATPase